jgi:hypothetical protein
MADDFQPRHSSDNAMHRAGEGFGGDGDQL